MGRPRHLLLAAFVFAAALVAVLVLRSNSAPHPPFPRQRAVQAAQHDPVVATTLKRQSWDDARVIALDDTHWRVTFFDGPRVLLDAAVGAAGKVDAVQQHLPGSHPPGSRIVWSPFLLVLLTAVCLFTLGVRPLRRLRNLDAAVLAGGLTLSAFLHDQRLLAAHVYVGVACLAYLAVRLAQVGLGSELRVRPAEPLYRRSDARLLRLGAGAALLGAVVVTVTSTGLSDVALAALAGATKLNHGDLPYGQLTSDVVHGDTYPLLTYVIYMPFAAISPVRDAFDSLDSALWLNAIALAGAAALLYGMAGGREDGTVRALAWLTFPPVLVAASTGGNDVPTALLVVAALALFARPALSTGALALAAWAKVIPGAVLLVWLPRLRGRSLLRACATAGAILAAGVLAIVVVGDSGSLGDTWDALRFQFERGSWFSLWRQTGWTWAQPVFQAATVAFAAFAAAEVGSRGPETIGLRQAAALAGAVIALLQIGANHWTYTYLAWLVPFILVALFPLPAETDPRARLHSPPP
jgi:hypothetical protein